MSNWAIDAQSIDPVMEAMKNAENPEKVINNVMKDYAAGEIEKEIQPLIHASGRTWKGKRASATTGQPFTESYDNLSVTISSKSAYSYLYFPDDGSNTKSHAGEQHFMVGGAEKAQDRIIDKMIEALVESVNSN